MDFYSKYSQVKCDSIGMFTETLGCFPKSCGAPPAVTDASAPAEVRSLKEGAEFGIAVRIVDLFSSINTPL